MQCSEIVNKQSKPHTTNFGLNELNFCLRLLTKQSVVFLVGKEHYKFDLRHSFLCATCACFCKSSLLPSAGGARARGRANSLSWSCSRGWLLDWGKEGMVGGRWGEVRDAMFVMQQRGTWRNSFLVLSLSWAWAAAAAAAAVACLPAWCLAYLLANNNNNDCSKTVNKQNVHSKICNCKKNRNSSSSNQAAAAAKQQQQQQLQQWPAPWGASSFRLAMFWLTC